MKLYPRVVPQVASSPKSQSEQRVSFETSKEEGPPGLGEGEGEGEGEEEGEERLLSETNPLIQTSEASFEGTTGETN